MEKLLLGAFLTREKLDIVNEQRARCAVVPLERLYAVSAKSVDHFAHELLRAQINDL